MDTFKNDTNIFFKKIVENHIEDNIIDYTKQHHLERYHDEPSFTGWEEILNCIVEDIEYQLEIDKEQYKKDVKYPYRIKIIKYYINTRKHTIRFLIINTKNNHILQTTLTISLSKMPFTPSKTFMNVSIISKEGSIVYI